MAQNLVIANKDNLVVYTFAGVDLTLATDVQVQFGAESYSLISNPTIVIVTSATELSLNLSATAEVGKVYSTVTYFDGASVNGTDITSRALGNSDQIVVAVGTQLIIEDGSIVANANSWATDEEFKAYANIEGIEIPATQPDREALLLIGVKGVIARENKLKGCRVSAAQELPYPRVGVDVNGFLVPSNAIHKNTKKAQMEFAIQAANSELFVSGQIQNIASEKLGELQVDYFQGGSSASIRTDSADVFLKPLMKYNGSDNRTVRV